MSLRRPTVACLPFAFNISPLCDVAQTSDCGMFVLYFCYKPFMWCCPDARLRHYYSCSFLSRSHSDPRLAPVLLFLQFPLEESFRPSFGTGITILGVSSRGVIQTLVWHPVFILGFREDYHPTSLLLFPCIIISMSERTG